jgi:hypothetical protein
MKKSGFYDGLFRQAKEKKKAFQTKGNICSRVDIKLKRDFDAALEKNGITQSLFIRTIIEDFVKNSQEA